MNVDNVLMKSENKVIYTAPEGGILLNPSLRQEVGENTYWIICSLLKLSGSLACCNPSSMFLLERAW